MSEVSLVVRHGSLAEIEAALTTAHERIAREVDSALDRVNGEIAGWSPTTASRAAEMDYQRRLREGVARLTAALEQVRGAVAQVAEAAHDTEVENVALIG